MRDLFTVRRVRARLLAAVATLLLLGVGRPSLAQERAVGLITHQLDRTSTRLLTGANVKHVKTTLYWDKWVADEKYRRSFADGMQRLAEGAPEITVVVHAAPSGSSYATRIAVYRDFAVFMKARAAQFPFVRNWQLWNEMDAPGWTSIFGSGVVSMYEQGRNYATMLQSAHDSIKKASPNAQVVIGGLAGPDDQIGVFLRGVYEGGGRFDVVAVHAYGPPIYWAARDRGKHIRLLMAEKSDTRPLWLTEFGISMARMRDLWKIMLASEREKKQMEEWEALAVWNDSSRVYDRLIGYVLIDASDDGYGIVRANGATRPAYTWLQARNALQ